MKTTDLFKPIIMTMIAMSSFALLLSSCHKDEKELEQLQSSGVVLIQNKGYYEVELPNGNSIYFSSYDAKDGIGEIAFHPDSVEVSKSYGSGFFVDNEGIIVTNNHVVSSSLNEKDIKKSVGDIFKSVKQMLEIEYDYKASQLSEVQDAYEYANFSPEISYTDFWTLGNIRDNLVSELQDMRSAYQELTNMNISNSEIKYHNEVSIAYNNTHVTKDSDFTECVIIKQDPEHDLALIQLKTKSTPADKYIFAISDEDPYETYSISDKVNGLFNGNKNEKIYLHGFNLGPVLAITNEGIKAQFTSGNVSQETQDRLMYTIPALQGSSGSPIVNKNGEVVAVNFAGVSGTQSFNYGVRVKHLRNLLKQ